MKGTGKYERNCLLITQKQYNCMYPDTALVTVMYASLIARADLSLVLLFSSGDHFTSLIWTVTILKESHLQNLSTQKKIPTFLAYPENPSQAVNCTYIIVDLS